MAKINIKYIILTAILLVVLIFAGFCGRYFFFNYDDNAWNKINVGYYAKDAVNAALTKITDAPEEFEEKTLNGKYVNWIFFSKYEITIKDERAFMGNAKDLNDGSVILNCEWYPDAEFFDTDGTYQMEMYYNHKKYTVVEGNFSVTVKASCNYPFAWAQEGFFNKIAEEVNAVLATLK